MLFNAFFPLVVLASLILGGLQPVDAQVRPGDAAAVADPASRNEAEPFQRQVSVRLGARESTATFAVPQGKRLVIEYVSVSGQLPFGQRLLVALDTSVDGEAATHFLVPARPDFARITGVDGDIVRFRQWLRVYADGGTDVKVRAAQSGHWGSGSASVTVTGFLVPGA
jgi:hypothetical protein